MKIKFQLILTMLIFGSIGIFTTKISISSIAIVQWRAIIGAVFIALFVVITKKKVPKNAIKKNIKPLLASGLMLGANWVFLFEAYKYTSVGIGTIIYYFAPVIVIVLVPFVFKEKIAKIQIYALILAVIGIFLVNLQSISTFQFSKGMIYAFIAAVLYALIVISNGFIKGLSGFDSTLFQLIISAVVMTAYSIISTGVLIQIPSGKDILFVAILGIVHTGVAYSIYFYALQKLKPQISVIISYIDPASAVIFAWAFLGETLIWYEIIGGVFILIASLAPQLIKRKI